MREGKEEKNNPQIPQISQIKAGKSEEQGSAEHYSSQVFAGPANLCD